MHIESDSVSDRSSNSGTWRPAAASVAASCGVILSEHRPVLLPEHRPVLFREHRPVLSNEHRPVLFPEHRPVLFQLNTGQCYADSIGQCCSAQASAVRQDRKRNQGRQALQKKTKQVLEVRELRLECHQGAELAFVHNKLLDHLLWRTTPRFAA